MAFAACGTSASEDLPSVSPAGLRLVVTPPNIDFGSMLVDTTRAVAVELKNEGEVRASVTMRWTSLVRCIAGELSGPLCIRAEAGEVFDGEVFELGSGERFRFNVVYSPREVSTVSGRIDFSACAEQGCSAAAVITGEARARADDGVAVVEVVPAMLSFSRSFIGTTDRRSVLITNAGTAPLMVEGVDEDVLGTGAFRVPGFQPAVVAPGRGLELTVEFRPLDTGSFESILRVVTDDPLQPQIEVPMRGDAVDFEACDFRVAPTTMTFGRVELGREVIRRFSVYNGGRRECAVTGLASTAEVSGFRLLNPDLGDLFIAPGMGLDVPVAFAPTVAGPVRVSIEIATASPDAGRAVLTGEGVASAQLVFEPAQVDFGPIRTFCTSSSRRITLTNRGVDTVRIDRVWFNQFVPQFTVGPADAPQEDLDLPVDLAPEETLSLAVSFLALDTFENVFGAIVASGVLEGRRVEWVVPLSARAVRDAQRRDTFIQSAVPRSSFALTERPRSDSLVVEVDGVVVNASTAEGEVAWRYVFASNAVVFEMGRVPAAGARIRVDYEHDCR